MQRRLVVAGAALLVVGIAALASAAALRSQTEQTIAGSLDQLEKALGGGATVRYARLEVALFGRGGTLHGLVVEVPARQERFRLTIERLQARGLAEEGAQGLRLDSGSAEGLVLVSGSGRWSAGRILLERAQLDDTLLSGPEAMARRLSFRTARVEGAAFARAAAPGPAPDAAAEPPAGFGPVAADRPRLEVALAQAEFGDLRQGKLERLRFERLDVEDGRGRQAVVAHGGLEGLDGLLLVSALAGQLLPSHPLFRALRLETVQLFEAGSELRIASVTAGQQPEGEALASEIALEGVTARDDDPRLGRLWQPIRRAGYGAGFSIRASAETTPERGQLRLRSLRVELPEAASLELRAELDGFAESLPPTHLEMLGETGLRARLVSADLVVVDAGGLDAILAGPAGEQGMTARQLRQIAAFRVAEALRLGQVPRDFGVAVQEFLAEPGRLEVRLAPDEPLPLLAFTLFALSPERAAERFRLTALSSPPG